MSSIIFDKGSDKKTNRISKFFREFSCSIVTGIAKVSVIQPFDFVRYRIQSSKEHKINIPNLISKVINKEGLKVLYKGLDITSLAVLLSSIVQFTLYQELLNNITKRFLFPADKKFEIFNLIEIEKNKLDNANRSKIEEEKMKLKIIKKFSFYCSLAGFFTGMGMGFLLTPIDNIRIKLHSDQNIQKTININYRFNNSIDCIKYTFTNSGLKGFYVALPLSMTRESIACTLYFGTFEFFKNKDKIKNNLVNIKLLNSFIYGAICGGLNWIVTLPIDIVKTKLIADTIIPNNRHFKGVFDCILSIYNSSGYLGFYKGFSVVFTRALIVNGVVLTAFDSCRSRIVDDN
jgi:hypothetical protein